MSVHAHENVLESRIPAAGLTLHGRARAVVLRHGAEHGGGRRARLHRQPVALRDVLPLQPYGSSPKA